MKKKKVYIVDYELISPLGVGREYIYTSLKNNLSCDAKIKRFDVTGLPFTNGAEIKVPLDNLFINEDAEVIELCKMDRKFELTVSAWKKAEDRILNLAKCADSKRTGVIMGVGADVAPYDQYEKDIIHYLNEQLNPIYELILKLNQSKRFFQPVNNPYDVHAAYLAKKIEAHAFQKTILTACVSSTQAIAFGFDALQRDEADIVLAGGTDSIINLLALISFGKLGVIFESNEEVKCRPFDRNRSGTIAGEAAGFLVLVSEKYLETNKLNPIAELTGYGNTLDAFKITAPNPDGEQMSRAILQACKKAQLNNDEIDYIQAHGTGTRQNDETELSAIKKALGINSYAIPISGTKDRHGHAIAAAGIQETVVLLESMKNNFIPGNMNLISPVDEKLILPKENQTRKIKNALTCNFAFGGINTVLALKNSMNES